MLYREIIADCSQIHTQHINTQCGQNVELMNVKLGLKRSCFHGPQQQWRLSQQTLTSTPISNTRPHKTNEMKRKAREPHSILRDALRQPNDHVWPAKIRLVLMWCIPFKTAYQNITMTEGNNLNKRPIYTGCLFYRSIFRIERLTSARAYRSLLRCLGQGSTARNLLCMVWASLK